MNLFLKSEFREINFNPNLHIIAYASDNTIKQLDSYPFGYFLIDSKVLIALAIRNEIEDNCIIVSDYICDQIADPLNITLKPLQFPLYNYNPKNKYNYLPKIPLAKKVSISIIYNKNASLVGLLKLMKPFIGMKEQRYSVNLNDPSIFRELQILNLEIPNRLTKNKDQMIHFQIRSEDQLNDYQIYDLRVAVIEQKEHIYDYLPKQYSKESFHSLIYDQGEFSQFKQTLTNVLLSKQSSNIILETNKNYGKRQLFRELAGQYGFNYHEKDVQTLTSVNHIKLFLTKSLVTHSMIFLRNISNLVQILQQSKSKSSKEDFESAIIKLQKYIKKSTTHQIILIIDMPSVQDYRLLKCYFDVQIAFKPSNDQTIVDIFQDYYDRKLDLGLIKLIPWRQVEKIIHSKDLEKLLQQKNKQQSIQSSTRQEDVGGMESVIKEISKTILMPQLYPEIFDEQVKPRRGILFFGPPGTGKTLLAKCISTELKMNFISVKGPEMLNMYIGESESNIRKLFQRARENAPCLIFFDELDSLAPARGNRGDSNQVMDRIVAQLLTEIDSLQQGVFIIGATNRPDLLDPSLLRPGRFDKLQYLGIKADRESRISILRAQTKSQEFDDIVDQLPPNFTGADFYGLTSSATVCATKRAIEQIQAGYQAEVKLQIEDFQEALKSLKPSVTLAELEKYEELRVKYSQN